MRKPKLEGYLSETDVGALLRPGNPFSLRTLSLWRKRGIGPPYVKIGQTILYPEAGLYRWLELRTVQPVQERRGRA